MKTVAMYRLLYGSDFIGESLASIYDHCERVLCFVGHEMFGGRRVIKYFGRDVYLPHDIDGVTAAIMAWKRKNDPANKVLVLPNPHAALLKGQVQRLVNGEVLPRYPDTTHVLFVEADEVWHEEALPALFAAARASEADEFLAQPALFWRSFRYCSSRSNPYAVLRAIRGRKGIGLTGHALMEEGRGVVRSETGLRVHNFGFAASERTVFWKHITALSFSRDGRLDCPPREEWFEDVWRAWDWETNRREDLCPSIGHELAFPPAVEYPFEGLPAPMKRRIVESPLPEWGRGEYLLSGRGGGSVAGRATRGEP